MSDDAFNEYLDSPEALLDLAAGYGATATLLYNARWGRLIGQALWFAHENMPNLPLEDDRMLGALARGFMENADELEGQ